jgi:2-C-methyl-D-erythritol 4-phosphate cytidylyltransferase
MPTDARDVCAIIVAPEQDGDLIWREVAGRPLLAWSIAAIATSPSIARILLVVTGAQVSRAQAFQAHEHWEKVVAILPGGSRRRAGIAAALRALPDECSLVAIHDALRPLVTTALIEVGVALARETGVAIPAEPVKDTIKRVRDGVIIGAVPRERLSRAQTPQFYALPLLQEAFQRTAPDLEPLDEAALLLAAGLPISCYAGDAENLRVASVGELPVVEELLRRRLA